MRAFSAQLAPRRFAVRAGAAGNHGADRRVAAGGGAGDGRRAVSKIVTVTAQKREENLQNVPMSVQVLAPGA